MLDKLQNINPNLIQDKRIKSTLTLLLNIVEELQEENKDQKEVIQELRDEINRLKGEQGKPTFKHKTTSKDISSEKYLKGKEARNAAYDGAHTQVRNPGAGKFQTACPHGRGGRRHPLA